METRKLLNTRKTMISNHDGASQHIRTQVHEFGGVHHIRFNYNIRKSVRKRIQQLRIIIYVLQMLPILISTTPNRDSLIVKQRDIGETVLIPLCITEAKLRCIINELPFSERTIEFERSIQ